jgi:Trk K+ transport system NAD-binding subunit
LALPEMLERVLLDADHSLAELKTPGSLVTQPVSKLAQYDITVLMIQRQESLLPCPEGAIRLEAGDTIFVVGAREKLLEVASLP